MRGQGVFGIVGHADLTAATLRLVESELHQRMSRLVPRGMAGAARVGSGLPVAFARAVRGAGLKVVAVLPALGTLPAPLPERDARAAGEMLMLAERVRLVEYDPRHRDACVTADEALIRSCLRVLAVWDGSWSTARDRTAHLVAYARGRGVPVDVVWPFGAARAAGPGALPGAAT
jgi:hypothetical protein